MSVGSADAGHGPQHGNDHDHGHGHGETSAHSGTMKEYVTGFVLAVVLTAIPFWLVMHKTFGSPHVTAAVILGLAAIQVVVHMVYFLHMNSKSEGGWSLLALLFTIMLVVIALSGSLWVMFHLNENMMPGMTPGAMPDMHDMRSMP